MSSVISKASQQDMKVTTPRDRHIEGAAANAPYFLPEDYCQNAVVEESERNEDYWTPHRILRSADYQHQVYQLARKIAKRQSAKTVLDVGCGVGTKLSRQFAAQFSTYGIDLPNAITHCRRMYPQQTWIVDDLSTPGLSRSDISEPIEIVICADVIEHLARPETLLSYIREFASGSTTLILSTPERNQLLGSRSRQPSNREHVREWTCSEFRSFIEANGWNVVQQSVVLPFRIRPNRFTFKYLATRIANRSPLRTCQVAVCCPADAGASRPIEA